MSKKLAKIIIPVCIVIAIAGIWVLKNYGSGSASVAKANEDFKLEADTIDLEVLTSYNLPIIIDFGADYCLPCREMAPILEAMNKEMQGKAIIKFVDIVKNADTARDFPIQVIPTQVFITADGKPYIPSEDIKIEFEKYSYRDTGEHAFTVHKGLLTEEQMRTILADMGVDE